MYAVLMTRRVKSRDYNILFNSMCYAIDVRITMIMSNYKGILAGQTAADRALGSALARGRMSRSTAFPIFVVATSKSYCDWRFCHT